MGQYRACITNNPLSESLSCSCSSRLHTASASHIFYTLFISDFMSFDPKQGRAIVAPWCCEYGVHIGLSWNSRCPTLPEHIPDRSPFSFISIDNACYRVKRDSLGVGFSTLDMSFVPTSHIKVWRHAQIWTTTHMMVSVSTKVKRAYWRTKRTWHWLKPFSASVALLTRMWRTGMIAPRNVNVKSSWNRDAYYTVNHRQTPVWCYNQESRFCSADTC